MSKGTTEDKSFKARVVYDFEAADDKELTIKEGEIVVVTDDSDSNWWKGSNHRGNGIFPSSFVSKDIESRGLSNSSNSSKKSSGVGKESEKSYLVRALYDFEAAEDNELTFKAGEMIVVIDDSNENWWKGSNERGDGLFPANFVTTELNDENGDKNKGNERRRSVQFNEEVNVKILEKDPEPVTIDEEKIDKLIHLLHEADPTGEEIDSDDLITLEEQCSLMGPLIDTELEKVDKRISQLNDVNASLVEAMNMYRSLMSQDSYVMQYGGYIPNLQAQTQMQPGQPIPGHLPQMHGSPMYGYPQQPGHQQVQGHHQQPPTSQVQMSPGQQTYGQQLPPGHQMPSSPQNQAPPPAHQMYPQQPHPGQDYQQQQPSYSGMYQQQQTNQQPTTMINGNDPRMQQQ